jgi:hypothetical protein
MASLAPNFFLVGAPKCGTTSLYFYLDQHPEIYMCPLKEPHFLADEIRLDNYTDRFRRMAEPGLAQLPAYLAGDMTTKLSAGPVERWEQYLRLFHNSGGAIAAGEASPCYLWSPTAPSNIAARFPAAKILMILRDPAERAFSQYLHMLTFADAPISFRAYVDQCLNSSSTRISELYPFLNFGFYARQVERYLSLFPPERVRVYWYEDLQRDPRGLLRDIFQFLAVNPEFRPDLSQRYMQPRVPRSYAISRALKPSWRKIKPAVPEPVAAALKNIVYRPRESMTMPAADRAFLRDLYRDDVRSLQHLTRRDLAHWQS